MINQNTIFAVDELARILAERKVRLDAKPDTPLELLVANSIPALIGPNEPAPEWPQAIMETSGRKNLMGDVQHDMIVEEYGSLTGGSIARSIDVARNKVNPMTRELVTAVDTAMDNASMDAPRHRVVTVFRPKIMSNYMLDELVERYENSPRSPVNFRGNVWPVMTVDALKAGLRTGIKRLDTEIEKWVAEIGDDALLLAYGHMFRNQDIGEETDMAQVNLLTFLWARTWLDNVPENVNSDLAPLRAKLAKMKASMGRAIVGEKNTYDRRLKAGTFINQWPVANRFDRPIIVQGETFNDWIKAGGTPEALMGACLKGQRPSARVIPDQIEAWQKAYAQNERMLVRQLTAKKEAVVAKAIADYVYDDILDIENPTDRKALQEHYQEFVGRKPYRSGRDLTEYCREVICAMYFPNSNALALLETMDEVMREFAGMDAREAATVASIEALADWLISLVDVTILR